MYYVSWSVVIRDVHLPTGNPWIFQKLDGYVHRSVGELILTPLGSSDRSFKGYCQLPDARIFYLAYLRSTT